MSKKYATITPFLFHLRHFIDRECRKTMFTSRTCLWHRGVSTIAHGNRNPSRPPACPQDIRDTVNPPRGFDQSTMLTSYQGLALLTLSLDKNWDSHSLVNGYPSFYPRIALVAPSPGVWLIKWPRGSSVAYLHLFCQSTCVWPIYVSPSVQIFSQYEFCPHSLDSTILNI